MNKLIKGFTVFCLSAALVGCGSDASSDDKTIKIGASVTPHAEIIENIKPDLEDLGYEVEIVEFSDYVKPNQALYEGEIDCTLGVHTGPHLIGCGIQILE